MRFTRLSEGVLEAAFSIEEALLLRSLPTRLEDVLENPSFHKRVTQRLFPRAYTDASKDEEYRQLLGDDLKKRKLECVRLFRETLGDLDIRKQDVVLSLTDEDFAIWLGFLNDFRILLGIELDIRDDDWSVDFDPEHPQAEEYSLLHYLTWLEEELLQASDVDLPQFGPDDF